MYKNKSSKKYFRFKIKATYYSSVIDETISMYFNYIVKIPKYYKKDIKEIAVDHQFIFEESHHSDESEESEESEESVSENENIVYSNYIRKINNSSNFSDRMNLISNLNVKPSVVMPIVKNELVSKEYISIEDSKEKDTDDIDDNDSDTNISVSSFENNESNDLFF